MGIINSSISNSEKADLKKFVLRTLSFAPILILIILINLIVDPSGLYSKSSMKNKNEKEIAILLSHGKAIGKFDGLDEKLIMKYFIDAESTAPYLSVLGSSRVIEVNDKTLGINNKSVRNNSITGTSLFGILNIFYNYEKKQKFPQKIILGLDPWFLNGYFNDAREYSIHRHDILTMLKIIGLKHSYASPFIEEKWSNLVSLSYFQKSLKNYFFNHKISKRFIIGDQILTTEMYKMPDGHTQYPEVISKPNPQVSTEYAIQYATQKEIYMMRSYQEMDAELKEILSSFLAYLIQKKIIVNLVIPPFHPESYKRLIKRADMKNILQSEYYFKQVGKNLGIPVLGSNDPKKFNLMAADFYDGSHLNTQGLEKFFKAIFQKNSL